MANQQAAVTVTGFVAGDPTLGGTESFRVLTFRKRRQFGSPR